MSKKELSAKSFAVMVKPTEEVLLALRESFPVEQSFNRILLPRLGMFSQDQVEGKGKSMKVTAEAGTFYIERETEELNDEGKKIWAKEELGTEIEATIIFQRKQLSYYDESTELYTSSPIYDRDDEVIPLFCDKKEIARGTPKELKTIYQYVDKDGKTKSKLSDNRILYIIKDSELYQLNLHGSSMYSFMTFARKTQPNAYLIRFNSEPKEKGQISWNMMTFDVVRPLDNEECLNVLDKVRVIKDSIAMEKGYYAAQQEVQGQEVVVAKKDGFGNWE